jgi:ribosome-associated inhibitor A
VIYITHFDIGNGMLESPRRERQEVKFMTMNITSKQMEITPAIRQHVADRLAKLENGKLI